VPSTGPADPEPAAPTTGGGESFEYVGCYEYGVKELDSFDGLDIEGDMTPTVRMTIPSVSVRTYTRFFLCPWSRSNGMIRLRWMTREPPFP